MKDILVVAKLKEGKFEKFMGFMQSEQGMNERRKIADLTKTLGTVSPDKSAVMFKIAVHDEDALNSFLDGSNPVSKPIFDEVMVSYEIFELNMVWSFWIPKGGVLNGEQTRIQQFLSLKYSWFLKSNDGYNFVTGIDDGIIGFKITESSVNQFIKQ